MTCQRCLSALGLQNFALHALGALRGKSFGVPCVPFMPKTLVHPKVCRNLAA